MAKRANAAPGGTDDNAYTRAVEELRELQPILWGFVHRNKNQHRRAAWLAEFGMLRRHVDKLVAELSSASASAVVAAKSGKDKDKDKDKKRKKGGDATRGKAAAAVADEKRKRVAVGRRARWLKDVLVPKCYLAFSQLAADNQFATLGIVLFGAVAQVNAICTLLVGDREEPAPASVPSSLTAPSSSAPVESDMTSEQPPSHSSAPVEGTESSTTAGKAISREAVAKLRGRTTSGGEKGTGSRTLLRKGKSEDASDVVEQTDSGEAKKKMKNISAQSNTKAGKRAMDEGLGEGATRPAKKTKKAKKKGDEFDDLFKGLF